MGNALHFVCRARIASIDKSRVSGLFDALIGGGLSVTDDNRVHTSFYQKRNEFYAHSRHPVPKKEICDFVAENVTAGYVSVIDYFWLRYGEEQNEKTIGISLSLQQKEGHLNLEIRTANTWEASAIISSGAFLKAVWSLVSYIHPIYGCVIDDDYDSIRDAFGHRGDGKLTYEEIISTTRFNQPDRMPLAIVFGPRGTPVIQNILPKIESLLERVYRNDRIMVVINAANEKVIQREILNSGLSQISEE